MFVVQPCGKARQPSVGKPHYSRELPRPIGLPFQDTKQFGTQAFGRFRVGALLCRFKVSPLVGNVAYNPDVTDVRTYCTTFTVGDLGIACFMKSWKADLPITGGVPGCKSTASSSHSAVKASASRAIVAAPWPDIRTKGSGRKTRNTSPNTGIEDPAPGHRQVRAEAIHRLIGQRRSHRSSLSFSYRVPRISWGFTPDVARE